MSKDQTPKTRMAQEFLEWLETNNIPVDKTPMWPLLRIADDGSILIEQMWIDGEGCEKVLHIVFREVATYMAKFPLVAEMPPQLSGGYERQRQEAHIRMRAVHVLRELQPSPTIINVNAGARLVFVTARELADGEGEAVVEGLKEILPDIMIRVVSGVDLVTVNRTGEETT